MPVVSIRHSPHFFENEDGALKALRKKLPTIVAQALTDKRNPATRLTARQITLEFTESSALDVNQPLFRVMVFAEGFPERLANIDDRAGKIATGLAKLSSIFAVRGYVWIYPSPKTGFSEIKL